MTVDTQALKTDDIREQQPVAVEYGPIINKVYTTLDDQLRQLFEGMVRSATAKMVAIETEADSNESDEVLEKQALERESLRYFLRDANTIHTNYFTNIQQLLKPGNAEAGAPVAEELSLVSHDEMEEMVAITTMNANALNDFGEAISDLMARIEYLGTKQVPIFNSEEISPKALCEIYQKTLNKLSVKTNVNLVLLKLFDEQVNKKLGNLYDSLNQIFIDAEIMPEVVRVSHHQEKHEQEESSYSTETVEYCNDQNSMAQQRANTSFIPHSQAELYDIVSQFTRGDISVTGNEFELPALEPSAMESAATGTPGPGSTASASPTSALPASFYKDPKQNISSNLYYQRKDVVRSLNRLQQRLLEQGGKSELSNTEEIKRSLIDEIGVTNKDGTAKEITVLDERNIDFVGMMFNAIAEDSNISEVVNNLVSLLHIPVIKVALDDEQLFQDKAHPTRKVLNLIPRAGKGVTDENDNLYNKIENVVKDILAEHEVDVDSFYKAVDALHTIIHKEEETAVNNEKEEQRNVIKEHARGVVVAELKKYTTGKTIPKAIQPLILRHISTLMLNRYVKHGAESIEWSHATSLCMLIIELLQPVMSKSQWQLFNNNCKTLIEVVNDELYETHQDKVSINVQILTLKSIFIRMTNEYKHFEMQKEEPSEPVIPYAVQKQMDDYDAMVASLKQQEESVVDKVARLPAYVKPGAWFEIHNGEGRPVRRLKMSIILLETAEIVFVDRKGIKGMAKDAGEFAKELASGKSRILEEHSTFDHALGKVISIMAA